MGLMSDMCPSYEGVQQGSYRSSSMRIGWTAISPTLSGGTVCEWWFLKYVLGR
jgi:hypothetical protein